MKLDLVLSKNNGYQQMYNVGNSNVKINMNMSNTKLGRPQFKKVKNAPAVHKTEVNISQPKNLGEMLARLQGLRPGSVLWKKIIII